MFQRAIGTPGGRPQPGTWDPNGLRDPAGIDVSHWQGHEADGRLYVPKAGEMLYKLKNPPAWQKF